MADFFVSVSFRYIMGHSLIWTCRVVVDPTAFLSVAFIFFAEYGFHHGGISGNHTGGYNKLPRRMMRPHWKESSRYDWDTGLVHGRQCRWVFFP